MKKAALAFVTVFTLHSFLTTAQNNNAESIKGFISSISALQNENVNSIVSLTEAAGKKASKTIVITKENIADALKEAQGKNCILIVENHTIVKFSDTKNCSTSGSWGVCMPYGEGYIQNGGLTAMKDYINNIIGKPDTQTRTLYVF